jgi:signal transduction histidine kinase
MNRNRLAFLQKYIDKQGLDKKKNSAILCDSTGRIISLAGFSYDIGLIKPVAGSNIADFHPVFVGLFPFSDDLLVLPNIETQPGVFWDIHLLQGNKLCWIIFEEKTEIVERFKPGIQERNKKNLARESFVSNGSEGTIIGLLDILVMKLRTGGEWERIGVAPRWYPEFFTTSPLILSNEKIIRVYPFLEEFIKESISKDNDQSFSGIWSESVENIEYHFRAQMIKSSPYTFFVIRKLHPELEVQQNIYQHAREQFLAYEELKKSAELAMELNHTKEQFISIISHDLRSPFISIISALDFLFEDPVFNKNILPEHREFLDYIHEDSKRLLDYLEKLLDWTRLDTGKLQPAIQRVDLNDIVRLSLSQFEKRVNDKEIKLTAKIPKNFYFEADTTLFSQVINNLIGNAIKFTPRGGEISIIAKDDNFGKTITIKDTGVGIPENKKDSLFKEYEKHYTYGTEGEKGSGIGLSITKKILDVHNYSIRCESQLQKGTEFIISL